MRIAVLGTGGVGVTLATRLTEVGHEVAMGSRTADNESAARWAEEHTGRHGTFADVAAWGELLVNATGGLVSVAAVTAAGAPNLAGKVLVDVSNPLDGSTGFPPEIRLADGVSVAEQLQRAFPAARVVKALNTMNATLMVHPETLPDPGSVFLAGDDADAKEAVRGLLRQFGWPEASLVDLGGIVAARGLEHYVRFWVDAMVALGTPTFNVRLVR